LDGLVWTLHGYEALAALSVCFSELRGIGEIAK